MAKGLTKMQRKILTAMRDGPAAFTGEKARKHGFGIFEGKHGGVIIRAYGTPEWFLKSRGLIEQSPRNVPGSWFRLTEQGRVAITAGKLGT